MADGVGFEPTEPVKGSTVFETAQFNHSCTSPIVLEHTGIMDLGKFQARCVRIGQGQHLLPICKGTLIHL